MHAPIPEVPPPAPRSAPKKPPLILSAFVLFGIALGFASLVSYTPDIPEISPAWERVLMAVALVIFHFVPLLLLWRGLRWARVLMLILLFLGLAMGLANELIPFFEDEMPLSPLEKFINALYYPYEVGLIVLLLTPAMRRHFAGVATQNS